jgi:hypothetical protein
VDKVFGLRTDSTSNTISKGSGAAFSVGKPTLGQRSDNRFFAEPARAEGRLSQALLNDTEGAPSAETVVNHFGSLHAAYAAVGYKPPARPPFGMNGRYWSKKAVLTGLQKLYTAQGRISNRLIDSSPGLPSQVHIRRHFGSVPEAMRQAGLPVLSHSQID